MPELPEVETICRGLNKVLKGKRVEKVEVLKSKSFVGKADEMKEWTVEKVGRKAKVIEIYFKGKKMMVLIHLKMTGQLVFLARGKRLVGGHPTADWVKQLPGPHTRVIWNFTDGSKLFFNDLRIFGWMKLVDKNKYLTNKAKQAPDVIDPGFSLNYFQSVLAKTRRAVKLVVLDQQKIGGVGNIYANDALYLAKIRPDRQASSLTGKEAEELRKALITVIKRGIKYGGSSAADEKFVNVAGGKGKYQEHFLVYERNGKKCARDGQIIKKEKLGGRGTYFCPKCQK